MPLEMRSFLIIRWCHSNSLAGIGQQFVHRLLVPFRLTSVIRQQDRLPCSQTPARCTIQSPLPPSSARDVRAGL
jgi:hypothetical protein